MKRHLSPRHGALLRCSLLGLLFSFTLSAQVWDLIPPADMSTIKLSSFEDSELDLPYYVANFHKVAVSVEPEDPHRGFIRAAVWRPAEENVPQNARVMENIIALAFFYTHNRPWNPWYGNPQLKLRLEAALSYWLSLQGPQGQFSETGNGEWSLEATAAATQFIGETLHMLTEQGIPPVNEDLVRQVTLAQRKAIFAVLYEPEFYEQGKSSASYYSMVWAGALAYLKLHPDEESRRTLETRLRSSMRDFQSPLGYYYQQNGPDMGLILESHLSSIRMAWHYAQGTGLEHYFLDQMKELYVWLVWNVSLEKDREGYYLNAAVNTTTNRSYLALDEGMPHLNGSPFASSIRLTRVFSLDAPARSRWLSNERKRLASMWPNLPELEIGNPRAYNPYTFLHRRHPVDTPSYESFREALTALPSTDPDAFNHVKKDPRTETMYYYANRPKAYYLMFVGGPSVHPRQTLGITLVRSHSDGTVLLAQPGNRALAWVTRPASSEDVYESTRIEPGFRSGQNEIEIKQGPNSMPEGEVVLQYAIGQGSKTITLAKDRIDVEIRHPGDFVEQVPLLILDNERLDQRQDVVSRGKLRLEHRGASATLGEAQDIEGPRKIQPVLLHGKDSLRYTLRF